MKIERKSPREEGASEGVSSSKRRDQLSIATERQITDYGHVLGDEEERKCSSVYAKRKSGEGEG